ncbi:alcohol dehydrogenase [Clavulina sp. PMI_390]|nr:alcohol dehydrogenase [Clavulina sp. PMI_390]
MSIPAKTKRVYLQERPKAHITPTTFATETTETPKPGPGEVLVKIDVVSLDPAMRGWLNDARSYVPPVKINETMRAGVIATVMTDGKKLRKGDIVTGTLGWAEYAVAKESSLQKLTPTADTDVLDYMGPLGMTGMTAYFGTIAVGQVKAGQTLVVSGAAGATGSMVCQIGKILGAKVIGIAGSADKCKWLVEDLGIDGAYNYKDKDWKQRFRKEVGYLDVFFDNVGGDILNFFLTRLNRNAKIVVCGAISDYNATKPTGITNYLTLISMRASMQGFIVFDYVKEYPKAEADISKWIKEGKIKRKFHVEEGLEKCPEYLQMLFNGGNTGKLLVRISKPTHKL